MKFRLTFKTPDVLNDAIKEAYRSTFPRCKDPECDSTGSCDVCIGNDFAEDAMRSTAFTFIRYGECIIIEFDTETGTAIVVPM